MSNSKADKVVMLVIAPTVKLVQAGVSTKTAKEMLPAMIRAWMALVAQQMKEDERLERSHRDVG